MARLVIKSFPSVHCLAYNDQYSKNPAKNSFGRKKVSWISILSTERLACNQMLEGCILIFAFLIVSDVVWDTKGFWDFKAVHPGSSFSNDLSNLADVRNLELYHSFVTVFRLQCIHFMCCFVNAAQFDAQVDNGKRCQAQNKQSTLQFPTAICVVISLSFPVGHKMHWGGCYFPEWWPILPGVS